MNKPLLILTLTTLGSSAAALWTHSQLGAERARNEELQARIATLEREPIAAFRTPSVAASAAAPMTSTTRTFANNTTPAETVAALPEMRALARVDRGRPQEMLQDPDFQRAMRQSQRDMLRRMYPNLKRELGISQEQADKLLDLLADQQQRSMQTFSGLDGSDGARVGFEQRLQERQRTHRAEIAQLVGNDGLARWESVQESMPVRMNLRNLRDALDGTDTPLRDDQRQALQDALVQVSRDMKLENQQTVQSFDRTRRMTPSEQREFDESLFARTVQMHERERQAAASILSQEQMREYTRLHEQQEAMQRALSRTRWTRSEERGSRDDSPPAPPGA